MRRRSILILVLLLLAFLQPAQAAAPATCGIFETRRVGLLWQIRVGCDHLTEWVYPASLRYNPEAFYPSGFVEDDGAYTQHGITGCYAAIYGCDPSLDGVYVEEGGQGQYVGYWVRYFPIVQR